MSNGATIDSASTCPTAASIGSVSVASGSQRSRIRASASSTGSMSTGGSVARAIGQVPEVLTCIVRQVVVRFTPGTV